jgi:hypothetical protein
MYLRVAGRMLTWVPQHNDGESPLRNILLMNFREISSPKGLKFTLVFIVFFQIFFQNWKFEKSLNFVFKKSLNFEPVPKGRSHSRQKHLPRCLQNCIMQKQLLLKLLEESSCLWFNFYFLSKSRYKKQNQMHPEFLMLSQMTDCDVSILQKDG